MDSVGRRVQQLDTADQVLVLGRLAQSRSDQGLFRPKDVNALCDSIGLPRPSNTSYYLDQLRRDGLVIRIGSGASAGWRISPEGRNQALQLLDDMDLAVLLSEAEAEAGGPLVSLGDTPHPVIPPWLAPPGILGPLHQFLDQHPFETNVFGMTRFPDSDEKPDGPDPVGPALKIARKVAEEHGLTFHLASDRKIVDDLWPNVAAHIWGCKYGIAFFEDRRKRGINYNLTIEVGSCLVLGRRLAILRDKSIKDLPSDLTGKIYEPVNLDDPSTVRAALEHWMQKDLGFAAP